MLSKSLIFVKRGAWLVFHQAGSSQNEQNVSLQGKTSESCLWASNTLVQKPYSFKFFSILKENCGADLNRWVRYTFLQKRCSFKSFSILEENCAADIIHETFKCKSFVGKCCKKRPLSKSYLPTKALFFFKSFSILEENCAADINDGTFKCDAKKKVNWQNS